jgi:pyrroline-5-carboxylate reductase
MQNLIVVSVKPQDFPYVAENFRFKLKEKQIILSIMAGVKIEKIQDFES